jgi:hypothetical protein
MVDQLTLSQALQHSEIPGESGQAVASVDSAGSEALIVSETGAVDETIL